MDMYIKRAILNIKHIDHVVTKETVKLEECYDCELDEIPLQLHYNCIVIVQLLLFVTIVLIESV